MSAYAEDITDDSVWITSTPSESARQLPFYITEMGHFYANADYVTARRSHDSCLFLYTVSGVGAVTSGDVYTELPKHRATVIDCRREHEYRSLTDRWEFIWFHFNGTAAFAATELITQRGGAANAGTESEQRLAAILSAVSDTSLANSFSLSAQVHEVLNALFASHVEDEHRAAELNEGVRAAAEFIEACFAQKITLDDILARAHMSKYHFIRTFHRLMGTSPYSYITDCRINSAKVMLRTSTKTVAEISECCGFADTSNFITHFKKRTGETPLQYRNDFR